MDFRNILFLDIETVPQYPSYDQLPADWKHAWDELSTKRYPEEKPSDTYDRAGIYAEFGKIVCISIGLIRNNEKNNNVETLFIKSYGGDDEKEILIQFCKVLNNLQPNTCLCAHNGKGFDYPYLCRRMIILGVRIPALLDIRGKKPWEINHLDTMEIWKFGDFKNFTSLKLMALALGIPSPKDDIDGSMVSQVYWAEKNVERIATYCEKDVKTLVHVYQHLVGACPIVDIVFKTIHNIGLRAVA